MAYKIYSVEPLPRQGRGESREYIMYNGFMIGPVPAGEWYTLKKTYTTIVHRDFEDRLGSTKTAIDDDIAAYINMHWGARGVAAVPEEDLVSSREKMEQMCHAANKAHREETVREFERQHEAWRVGQPGRAKASPYEEECYQVLGWPAPNSEAALRAQRLPGEAAAERMMEAFEKMANRAAAPPASPLTEAELEAAKNAQASTSLPKGVVDGRSSPQNRSHKAS